jgi:hypothetical protein
MRRVAPGRAFEFTEGKAADQGSRARPARHWLGIEPSADCDILHKSVACGFREWARLPEYERSGSGMTRRDFLGILSGAAAESGVLRILVRERCATAAMPGDPS